MLIQSARAHEPASVDQPFRLGASVTFASNKEQVKGDSGASPGPTASAYQFALTTSATYAVSDIFDLGLFAVFENGRRYLATYSGTDANGNPALNGTMGGNSATQWFGPVVRADRKSVV